MITNERLKQWGGEHTVFILGSDVSRCNHNAAPIFNTKTMELEKQAQELIERFGDVKKAIECCKVVIESCPMSESEDMLPYLNNWQKVKLHLESKI